MFEKKTSDSFGEQLDYIRAFLERGHPAPNRPKKAICPPPVPSLPYTAVLIFQATVTAYISKSFAAGRRTGDVQPNVYR
jgi:hypothetical protein